MKMSELIRIKNDVGVELLARGIQFGLQNIRPTPCRNFYDNKNVYM